MGTTQTVRERSRNIIRSLQGHDPATGRTRIHVTWELSVKEVGKGKCEFTNRVRSSATEEMLTFLARQWIPCDQFRAQRQPASIAHNQGETPLFAASIERAALRN
jgi:hypothetical protein